MEKAKELLTQWAKDRKILLDVGVLSTPFPSVVEKYVLDFAKWLVETKKI